jgi:hypothetical protein
LIGESNHAKDDEQHGDESDRSHGEGGAAKIQPDDMADA